MKVVKFELCMCGVGLQFVKKDWNRPCRIQPLDGKLMLKSFESILYNCYITRTCAHTHHN